MGTLMKRAPARMPICALQRRPQRARAAGFTLTEILVGLAIGLLTVLVVLQVLSVAEARQRATTSGSDAVVNATLGLFTIERDARNAGFGLASVRASIGCEVRYKHGTTAAGNFTLAPIVLTDGASGAPDSVQVMASNKNGVTLPTRVSIDHAQADANFFVESDLGVANGDMMVAVPASPSTATPLANWCSLFQVAGASGGQNQVPHVSGLSQWNQAGAAGVMPAAGYDAGDYLINLGSFVNRTYGINSNALRMVEVNLPTNASTTSELYPDVVQLQAVYGKDTSTPSDDIVDTWTAAAPTTAAGWQQVRAVRIALVARGNTLEPENVTLDGAAAASTCNSATPHPAALCWRPDPAGNGVKIDVNINNANPNWRRYRYRVVESTIALRNVIWQQ